MPIESGFYEFSAAALDSGRTTHNVRSYKWRMSFLRIHCGADPLLDAARNGSYCRRGPVSTHRGR